MILYTSPYRLVVLPGIIVLIWLLVLVGVFRADVAVSVSTIVVLCALARWADGWGRAKIEMAPTR